MLEGVMKKLLSIIPLAISAASCVPIYGAYAPPAGYAPAAPRAPYQPMPIVNPGPMDRWTNVMLLTRGAEIAVVTDEGQLTTGNFLAATSTFVRMVARAGEIEIPAASVVRVDLMRGGRSTVARDAAAGGAFGAGVVGLLGLAGGQMPPARLFAAGAILGAYESAAWGRQVNSRSSVTIYVASPPR
jgi:hypothetical protein